MELAETFCKIQVSNDLNFVSLMTPLKFQAALINVAAPRLNAESSLSDTNVRARPRLVAHR